MVGREPGWGSGGPSEAGHVQFLELGDVHGVWFFIINDRMAHKFSELF